MKLKLLSIYSIISLLYGENLFAIAGNKERGERLTELEEQTKDVDVKSRREMWENRIKESQSLTADTEKSFRNTRKKAEIESQNESEINTEDENTTDSRENTPRENSPAGSQIVQLSEEINAGQSVSSDFEKFAENFESKFSESKKVLDELEQKVEDFSGELKDTESSVEQQQKAESLKKDMVDWNNKIIEQIDEFKKIQKDFEGLEIDKKIKQLNDYRVRIGNMSMNMTRKISQIHTNRRKEEKAQKKEQKRLAEQMIKSIDWQAIRKYNEESLSAFVKAVQNYKLRFSVVQKYGKKCFDDQDGSALFDPNLKMDSSLKGLCKQISQVRFPEAIKVWSEIKVMKEDDPNYAATLDQLREKIRALGKNVSSLIKQGGKAADGSKNSQN
ncbi:MAG: hypothetical protein J5821_02120 [Alphaproteobacteria bacterium]|nr:hypothetical protein [Alphaproteobacteria bacterium]